MKNSLKVFCKYFVNLSKFVKYIPKISMYGYIIMGCAIS